MASLPPAVDALAERLEAAATGTTALPREDALARTLARQYPSDVGVLASYFLNYVALPDGAALALAANEPHAYVSGNLVECMAASDNVIRAGLTPKPRDTDALCASLTYAAGPPCLTPAVPVQEYVTRYAPPFDEFEVQRVALPPAAAASAEGAAPPPSTLLPPFPGPAIVLVTGGGAGATLTATATPLGEGDGLVKARTVARGDVIFVPAATPLALAGAGLTAWIATVNGRVFGGEEALVYVAPAEAAPAATAAVA
jgi:mannose-6-phosphate isomerase